MVRAIQTARRYFLRRSVVVVFLLYVSIALAPLFATLLGVPSLTDTAAFELLIRAGITQAILIGRVIDPVADFILGPSNDLLFNWVVVLFSYYLTAVVVAIPARRVYRQGRRRVVGGSEAP